jgi:hypothetical protein
MHSIVAAQKGAWRNCNQGISAKTWNVRIQTQRSVSAKGRDEQAILIQPTNKIFTSLLLQKASLSLLHAKQYVQKMLLNRADGTRGSVHKQLIQSERIILYQNNFNQGMAYFFEKNAGQHIICSERQRTLVHKPKSLHLISTTKITIPML